MLGFSTVFTDLFEDKISPLVAVAEREKQRRDSGMNKISEVVYSNTNKLSIIYSFLLLTQKHNANKQEKCFAWYIVLML